MRVWLVSSLLLVQLAGGAVGCCCQPRGPIITDFVYCCQLRDANQCGSSERCRWEENCVPSGCRALDGNQRACLATSCDRSNQRCSYHDGVCSCPLSCESITDGSTCSQATCGGVLPCIWLQLPTGSGRCQCPVQSCDNIINPILCKGSLCRDTPSKTCVWEERADGSAGCTCPSTPKTPAPPPKACRDLTTFAE
eukprot:Sspe_Gene.110871::Locus_91998_Transcript_1_2_Confidence_0.500_Length_646::g.110871::m.110871